MGLRPWLPPSPHIIHLGHLAYLYIFPSKHGYKYFSSINSSFMELRKSNRKKSKIRLALQGPSGSGKTFSALLIAFGLCGSWNKIAVIDSENHSSELYSHLGGFSVIDLKAPFTPERYMEAIKLCEISGIEVIIIDSISHEWESEGGILS